MNPEVPATVHPIAVPGRLAARHGFRRPGIRHAPPGLTLFVEGRLKGAVHKDPPPAPYYDMIGRRLEELVADFDVAVLHDLRGSDFAPPIDHVCVGPGGVTVIDSKSYEARVRGRGGELWVGRRNNTTLVPGVLAEVDVVRDALEGFGLTDVDVRGAICSRHRGGLRIRSSSVDGVRVDDLAALARLARREPIGPRLDVERAAESLRLSIGSAFAPDPGVSENGNSASS